MHRAIMYRRTQAGLVAQRHAVMLLRAAGRVVIVVGERGAPIFGARVLALDRLTGVSMDIVLIGTESLFEGLVRRQQYSSSP